MVDDITTFFQQLESALSQERISRYKELSQGNTSDAFKLYRLNVLLCERLYTPLHMLEVTLRNNIDRVLTETYGNQWFDNQTLINNQRQLQKISESRERLSRAKFSYTKGHLIADLTLGFWATFFNKQYEILWQETLHQIGRAENGKGLVRSFYSKRLNDIRDLRNRIAHHEPIYHLNLPLLYGYIMEVIMTLSPTAHQWVKENGSFESLLEEYYFLLEKKQ